MPAGCMGTVMTLTFLAGPLALRLTLVALPEKTLLKAFS